MRLEYYILTFLFGLAGCGSPPTPPKIGQSKVSSQKASSSDGSPETNTKSVADNTSNPDTVTADDSNTADGSMTAKGIDNIFVSPQDSNENTIPENKGTEDSKPESIDTDEDGLSDEVDDDDDNDGVSDADELAWGTDPLIKDTDNDGVDDGQDAYPNDPEKVAVDNEGLRPSGTDKTFTTSRDQTTTISDPRVTTPDSTGSRDRTAVIDAPTR